MAWLDWVEMLTAKVQGKKCDARHYNYKSLEFSQFDNFAAVMSPPEDREVLDTYSFCAEVSNICLMALGAEPSRATLVEAVQDYARLVEPTRFLALTVARSEVMDGVLSPVLSKRLRAHLHATYLVDEYSGECAGPAPGEQPWELVEAVLEAKAEAASRKRPAPANDCLLLLSKCRGRRKGKAEVPPFKKTHVLTILADLISWLAGPIYSPTLTQPTTPRTMRLSSCKCRRWP